MKVKESLWEVCEIILILCVFFYMGVACLIVYLLPDKTSEPDSPIESSGSVYIYKPDYSIRPSDMCSNVWEEKEVALWVLDNKAVYLTDFDESDALALVELTKEIAEKYTEIDYRYILALICRESRFDKDAVSSAGAVGYTQIVPKWFGERAQENGFDDLFEPKANITLCVLYLDEMYQETGDLRLATIGYGIGLDRALAGPSIEAEQDLYKLEAFYTDLLERVS